MVDEEDDGWIKELEEALLADCDLQVLQKITTATLTHQKPLPHALRHDLWQTCLGVKGRSKILEEGEVEDSELIAEDVASLSEDESVRADLVLILSNFSRLTATRYRRDNGWLPVLASLLPLQLESGALFKCFEAITLCYVPRCFTSDGQLHAQPFHLLRLLLLYHEPELCSYLDTLKITPDQFALTWLSSLFAGCSDRNVTQALWDVYFSLADPFLVLFLALVMLVNAKDDVLAMKESSREDIIDFLRNLPSQLEIDDIGDMFYIVEQHYVSKTPATIRQLHSLLFESSAEESPISDLSHLLCLPVAVAQLVPDEKEESERNAVRYFVVDCRPAEQYNNGHLSTAFHLDCGLMLADPAAFAVAVAALMEAQQQALRAGSVAGGQHLCFLGSGRDEEDRYVHMVVASFLQKHHQFVSLADGGFRALHALLLAEKKEKYLLEHSRKKCLVCSESSNSLDVEHLKNAISNSLDVEHLKTAIFDRFRTTTSAVRSKTNVMKEKLAEYVTNSEKGERHVSAKDKVGKRYGQVSFALDDDYDDEVAEIELSSWSKSDDVLNVFSCHEVDEIGQHPAFLAVTKTHLLVLREVPGNRGVGRVVAKRPLEMVVQITSKRRNPNLITFKYGESNEHEQQVVAADHILLPKPYEATRLIKQQVIRILDENASSSSSAK